MDSKKRDWIDYQNTKVLQKVVILDDASNILIIKRREEGSQSRGGKWDLPGGNMDIKDLGYTKPHLEALKREIKEETGLLVENLEEIFVDSWVVERQIGKILGIAIGFKAKIDDISPDINLSKEHIEYKWVKITEVDELDFGEDGNLHKNIISRI